MVTRWGLSAVLGAVTYGENQEEVFLDYSVARRKGTSQATVESIDAEIRRLIEDACGLARRILTKKHLDLETLARALLAYETLSGDEIRDLLDGKAVVRARSNAESARRFSTVPLIVGADRDPRARIL